MNMEEKVKEKFKKLGIQIKKLREARNLTTTELSEKTGIRKEYLQTRGKSAFVGSTRFGKYSILSGGQNHDTI
jgi:hypothetical protein